MTLNKIRNKLNKTREILISQISEEEENLRNLLIQRGLINIDPLNNKIICEKEISVKKGPWGTIILKFGLQELFLDCYYSSKIFIKELL